MGLNLQRYTPPQTDADAIRQVQTYADQYFLEYQAMCLLDREFARTQVEAWEAVADTIVDMPIEEQAKYADYVTAKISKLPLEILLPFIRAQLNNDPDGTFHVTELGSCAVGNIAKMILMLPDPSEREAAQIRFRAQLKLP